MANNETTDPKNDNVEEFSLSQQLVCSIIPSLSNRLHKGQSGRIGIIGGCREYTGAPYYAAISSLKVGADLSYVFCTSDSAQVIKSYSPELIVHPILDGNNAADDISAHLSKLHALVIGPGLGRDDSRLGTVGVLINNAKQLDLPIVLDADALYFVSQCPDIVKGYTKAILTPNAMEFDRLYAAVFRSEPSETNSEDEISNLCKTLGYVTIIRKGQTDIISDGHITVSCSEEGSFRRCGGQGDLLSGSLGTFTFWSHFAFNAEDVGVKVHNYSPTVIASLGSCLLTRRCNKLAFSKFGRSMLTSDMINEIRSAFTQLFPVD